MQFRVLAQAIELGEGDALPTEFRLFKVGVNESTKGPTVWDARAAELVMSKYARRGVPGTIDLNHDSLDPATRRARRDACDALGSYRLELRNGELWMVDIKFNAEGTERLLARKQRFFSPAFLYDPKTDQAVELINVALVADPATYDAQPLIAASSAGTMPVNMATRIAARAFMQTRK